MKKMQLAWKDMDTIESNRMVLFFLLGEEGVEKICSKVCRCQVTPASKYLVGHPGESYNMQLFDLNVFSFAFQKDFRREVAQRDWVCKIDIEKLEI